MKSTVAKAEILEILKENREQHREDYQNAVLGWLSKATLALNTRAELFETALQLCQDGKPIAMEAMSLDMGFDQLKKPVSHISDYDKAIRMIDLNVEDVIELDDAEFEVLVLDEWGWKPEFYEFNDMYIRSNRAES